MVVQCALTIAFGFLGFWWAFDMPNTFARTLATLIAGFGGVWLTMFCWTWARHGWKAARTLSMDPS